MENIGTKIAWGVGIAAVLVAIVLAAPQGTPVGDFVHQATMTDADRFDANMAKLDENMAELRRINRLLGN